MAGSTLTREQNRELDAITPILPDAVVASMSRHEAKNYKELLTARDQVEAYMLSQAAMSKPQQPAPTATVVLERPLDEAPPLPDDLLPPAPPAPVAPLESQTLEDQPTDPSAVETGIPTMQTDPADIAAWSAKLKTMEERYKNAQSALSPAQQHAASLRKKLSASEQASADLRTEMQERMDRIEQLLKARPEPFPPPAVPVVTLPDPFEGLADVDPDLDRRLRALQTRQEAELAKVKAETEKLHKALEAREVADREASYRTYMAEHDAKVASLVPEFKTLVGTDEGRNAIAAWMQSQPPMVQSALQNPYGTEPHNVAYALNLFKSQQKSLNGTKRPSLGDLAATAKLSPATPLNEGSTGLDIYSDAEMNNLDAVMHEAQRKGHDLEAIIAKAERTLLHKQKIAQRR